MMMNWTEVSTDVHVKLEHLYEDGSIRWKSAHSKAHIYASCPRAGPIAIATVDSTGAWHVDVCTASGVHLGSILDVPSDLSALFWSSSGRLHLLTSSARLFAFNATASRAGPSVRLVDNVDKLVAWRSFTSSKSTKGQGPEAPTFCTGIAVLDSLGRFFMANDVREPAVWTVECPSSAVPSTSTSVVWTVLAQEGQFTQLLLVSAVGQLLRAQQGSSLAGVRLPDGLPAVSVARIVQIEAAPNNEHVAMLWSNRLVAVLASSLESVVWSSAVDCLSSEPTPSLCALHFCGSPEAIALCYRNAADTALSSVILIGDKRNERLESVHSVVECTAERDGVRLFTESGASYWLSVVSRAEWEALAIASLRPAAVLLGATRQLAAGHAQRALDHLASIGASSDAQSRLTDTAIADCLKVAQLAWPWALQKLALNAVTLGRRVQSSASAKTSADIGWALVRKIADVLADDQLVTTISRLRLLNQLRAADVGFPITYAQLEELQPDGVLNLLLGAGLFWLAERAAIELGVKEGANRVVVAWLLRLLSELRDRDQSKSAVIDYHAVAQRVSTVIQRFPAVSYAAVAVEALHVGVKPLAVLLADMEKDDAKRVKLLLQLDIRDKALLVAIESTRPELLHQVITHLKGKESRDDLLHIIRKHPRALTFYQQQLRFEQPKKELDLLRQNSEIARTCLWHLDEALRPDNVFESADSLDAARAAAQELGEPSSDGSVAKLIDDCIALQKSNEAVERKTGKRIPPHDRQPTLAEAVMWAVAEQPDYAEQLRKDHRISERLWWAWRVEGLAKAAKWEQVLQMACSTKSPPIGFIPFVSAAARYTGGDAYMARLLERVPPADQIQARIAARDFIGAAELAVARKDTRALEMVRHSAFGQRELYAKIGDMLTALTST